MGQRKRGKSLKNWQSNQPQPTQGKLRIVGGKFRGRQITYSGELVTRPMKDNIREALFNLVGGWVKGKAVFDLFAGTGVIGLESVSRGAVSATMIERHFPTVKIIEENIASLGDDLNANVHASDTFFWVRQFAKLPPEQRPDEPWMVFCCPPYDFFVERTEDVVAMLESMIELAPANSIFIVESDKRFDHEQLPQAESWEIREYSPAVIAVLKMNEP
jgi:16S rRNA (guanine(966)-N(2))-methyltransferase RsmD